MKALIRIWLIRLIVLFAVSYLIALVISADPVFDSAIWIFLGLIIAGWVMAFAAAISGFISYKLFGDEAASKLADAISAAGGLPKPDEFSFDLDDYLAAVRTSSRSTMAEVSLASELNGSRDAIKLHGGLVNVLVNEKLVRRALAKIHKL